MPTLPPSSATTPSVTPPTPTQTQGISSTHAQSVSTSLATEKNVSPEHYVIDFARSLNTRLASLSSTSGSVTTHVKVGLELTDGLSITVVGDGELETACLHFKIPESPQESSIEFWINGLQFNLSIEELTQENGLSKAFEQILGTMGFPDKRLSLSGESLHSASALQSEPLQESNFTMCVKNMVSQAQVFLNNQLVAIADNPLLPLIGMANQTVHFLQLTTRAALEGSSKLALSAIGINQEEYTPPDDTPININLSPGNPEFPTSDTPHSPGSNTSTDWHLVEMVGIISIAVLLGVFLIGLLHHKLTTPRRIHPASSTPQRIVVEEFPGVENSETRTHPAITEL